MPTHSNMNQSKQQASIPPEQRPTGADPQRGAGSGELQRDATDNPSGERERGQAKEQQQQGNSGSTPGLKDRDNPTSDSYGNTRDSGDPASR